jgi:ABC-2 type transport system permease protein
VYFPSALLVGKAIDVWQGIGIMAGWMAVFFVISRWLWRKGIKQYSGMGA